MALTPRQQELESYLTAWVLNESRRRGETVTLDELDQKTRMFSAMMPELELDEPEIEQVRLVITQKMHISQNLDVGIVDSTFRKWISERKPTVEERRWIAYRQLLVNRGWAPQVIAALEQQTDDVVELMGDPTVAAPWARRGLLMGEVQSGKTATYLGVLNKAIDYGYRVIIIIGGHTDDLRNQTQERVDSDLTGTNSSFLEDNISGAREQMRIGIGLLDRALSTIGMTTARRDFSASSKLASTVWVDTGVPTVFVIKKNVKMLENVASYIRAQAGPDGFDLPLVVVDDESDWGSPNTADINKDPTRVNKAIRSLLEVSSRSTYLGITATPFANVLIDHTVEDDLFPIDYIRALSAPSHYLGADSYFDSEGEAVYVDVDDCLEMLPLKHKKDHPFTTLPPSLEDAIIAFFVGTAIRHIRTGMLQPASMMVNVSRFNQVQALVHNEVSSFAERVKSTIVTEFSRGNSGVKSALASRIESLAESHYQEQLGTDFSWGDIASHLVLLAPEYRTELVNNQTKKVRETTRRLMTQEQRAAHDARPVIYVGGDVLSRGLTLEGLQVSYFVRQPRSADTLLQMGRWFGYRPGYEDLVKIWMSSDVNEIFGNVARMSQELREDLRQMEALSLTPRQFGIKIRLIPEIAIVAANKRRAAAVEEVVVNLHGQVKNAVNLDESLVESNERAVAKLVSSAMKVGAVYTPHRQPWGWSGVPLSVVTTFFKEFAAHESDLFFGVPAHLNEPMISRFLPESKNSDSWTVVIVNGSGDDIKRDWLPGEFKSSKRNNIEISATIPGRWRIQASQPGTESDLANALTTELHAELRNSDFVESRHRFQELYARSRVQNPMILLYAITGHRDADIETGDPGIDIASTAPLWTVKVAFPALDLSKDEDWVLQRNGVKILVNSVWQEQVLGISHDEDAFDEEVDG